jgi:hypothetical protein
LDGLVKLFSVLWICCASLALGQEDSPPPLVQAPAPMPVENTRPAQSEAHFFQRCFGVPSQPVVFGPSYGLGINPVPINAAPASANTTAKSSGGISDAKSMLAVVVVLVAVLPVLVYLLDDEATELVHQRFQCPSFSIEVMGHGQTSTTFRNELAGSLSARVAFGFGHFGSDVGFEFSPFGVSNQAGHLSLRFTPKAHIEASASIGYRRNVLGNQVREGLDMAVPNEYFFWREGLTSLGIELRPSILFGPSGVDLALETYLVSRPWDLVQLRLGGRVMSFGEAIVWSFSGGVALSW